MPTLWLVLIILGLALVGMFVARSRAISSANGDARAMHSLPRYYGFNALILTAVPSLLLLALWSVAQPAVLDWRASENLPDQVVQDYGDASLAISDVKRVANGLDLAVSEGALTEDAANEIRTESSNVRQLLGEVGVALGSDPSPALLTAAQKYRKANANGTMIRTIVVLLVAAIGCAIAVMRAHKDFRARNFVEQSIRIILVSGALVAILTTVGILLSLVFNTYAFFSVYPWTDFLFGTTWSPSFQGKSELGVLPLLWGTLYISIIALLVAVPIGLFAAIYLAEYASKPVRGFMKPALEVLAGIPSIVYGLFALLTVGPFLLEIFGQGGDAAGGWFGLNWMQNARSVLTAGVVMGIMLIPFVSSLSDDIINAVPQALRDGSLGMGATPSETIRKVVLPAALPGIVGAIILAASRAIGETMLVVFGAGAAGALGLNPLEAMTTVTAKIVSQLTGDADFSSPEALVAYALGTLLFIVTLGLNLIAQAIVRKYREAYE